MKTLNPTAHLLFTARCQENLGTLSAALCFELTEDLPDWVRLIPVGEVLGRDGRQWINDKPEAVISHTKAQNREQPLDFEHSTEIKAPKGEEAPAAGWFSDYRIENGFIEGRLTLNPKGLAAVKNREYRYLSPVFRFDKESRVYDITSAALTNKPNLLLPALNHQQNPQEKAMTLDQLMAALREKLQLASDATPAIALNRISELQGDLQTAKNREHIPNLEKYVPRADYDGVLARATNAEQKLVDAAKAEKEVAISSAIESALKAGKIAPASVEYHTATCRQDGGLEAFKAYVEKAPIITGASGLEGKKPGDTDTALNAEIQTLATLFGNSADDLKKHGGLGQ